MDILLVTIGFIFALLGIAGAFLPVLPGPIMGWAGLLLLYLTKPIPMNYWLLGITLCVSILIWVLDYIIPAIGTKRFGGSKYGSYGTTIGLIVGLIAPIPLGFILGALLGAFVGEMIYNSSDVKRALKAAFGSFMGFLASTTLKFIVSLIFLGIFIQQVVYYWDVLKF